MKCPKCQFDNREGAKFCEEYICEKRASFIRRANEALPQMVGKASSGGSLLD